MGRVAGDYLQDLGVSAADRAVMEFLYPDEKLSAPEIASRYSVSRQHVQVTVNSLAQKKLVVMEENPRHKRSSLIVLTTRGKALFRKIRERDRKVIDDLFSGIPAGDKRSTLRTLQAIYSQLDEQNSNAQI
jgi:DNA-binding MarR family transcriptional regulator